MPRFSQNFFERRSRSRPQYGLILLVTIAAGLASRRWGGTLPHVLAKYPGDVLWAIALFLVIGLAFTTWSTARVAAITLSLSLLVEFAKFIPWLGPFRRTTMGHLLLGQVFSFGNLASYCLGVLIGCGMECLIIHPRRPGRLSWAGTHALAPGAARGANSG